MLKKINKLLLLILALALFLRLFGINHGYPFVFHPDESTIIQSALGIRFDINPAHFDWPHLYIYLNYFLYMIFAKVRNVVPQTFSIIWNDEWIFYLLSRIFSAILSSFTIVPIYLTGKKLFNKNVGLLSALALSVVPFHVCHSHYALSDAPMVFFLSWGLYFSACILKDKKLSNYIFAGLFVGLSASTKYNGGLSAIMVPLATIFYNLGKSKKIKEILKIVDIKNWVIAGLFSVFGFLLGTPFALFDFKTFTRTDGPKGALWQFTNVGSVTFLQHVNQFFNSIIIKIFDDLGYTILIGFIITLAIFIYKLIKKEINYSLSFILIMGLFFIWYISGFAKVRSHYLLIAYPFIVLGFGYFLDNFKNKYFFYILMFCLPLLLAIKGSLLFNSVDTRVQFYNWVKGYNYNEVIVYDDEVFNELLSKAEITNKEKGFDKLELYNNGYLILTDDDNREEIKNVDIKEVLEFNNINRRGPNIEVYRFEK